MVTNENGNVVGRHDYAPFGVEIAAGTDGRTGSAWGATTDVSLRFTGQLRDTETGEDYFNARFLYAGLGRFLSADPGNAGADITNPQSWNGYGYVLGNPLKLTDRSGKAANYSGIPDGVCPASQASCNVAWTSLAPSSFWQNIPSITPNDMNYGLAAYLNNVRYGGYGGGPAAAWSWVAGDDPRVIMGYAALSSPDEVTGAAATAQLALSSPSCAALFSGLGNGTTGWSLLSQVAVSYGGLLPERLGQTFGSNDLANPTPGSNSIVINNYSSQGGLLPASPFSGMSGQRAAQAGAQTIIHELLHVAIMMYGPGAVTPPSGALAPAWMQKDSGPGIPDSAERPQQLDHLPSLWDSPMMTARVLLFLSAINMARAGALPVCDVLQKLSSLNGTEVRVRGVWLMGDMGDVAWAPLPCGQPITRDGWQWPLEAISVAAKGGVGSMSEAYSHWKKLGEGGNRFILATFTGKLVTNGHFKVSHSSHLPLDFGYCVAALLFDRVEDLEAIPISPTEELRLRRQQVSPTPIRMKKH